MPASINDIGEWDCIGCERLFEAIQFGEDEDEYDNDVVNRRLMQRHANLPFHQACFSTSINPQGIQVCFQEHGIERATTEIDDQQMTALHILCANPFVTGDAIRAYLQLAPEAAEQQDSEGMTHFQRLWRNDMTFLEEVRSFSSLMAWWYACMPPQIETGKKRKWE